LNKKPLFLVALVFFLLLLNLPFFSALKLENMDFIFGYPVSLFYFFLLGIIFLITWILLSISRKN